MAIKVKETKDSIKAKILKEDCPIKCAYIKETDTSIKANISNSFDNATTTKKGIVRLATETEAKEGILNNNVVINPYTLKSVLVDIENIIIENYTELSGDIADLTTTVTDNYNTLSGQISDLTSTVNDNYTSLDNRLTTAEGSILDLTDTVNDNYTELDGKITTTNNNLSTLSQTVEDNNTAVNSRIDETNDTVSDLSDTVTSNYNTLDGKIDVEISNRTSADTTLQNNIDIEASTRQNADTVLQNNINTLSQTVTDNNTAINNRVDGIVESFDGDISDLNDAIDNLSDTVSDNYTDLNDKITDNTDDITTIQNTINSYGDIVSYNAAYFATANQGSLADTALQPNDNISELVNNVGYITSASLPTVNNATITIQKNGSNVGTFTLNQANNDTLNITVPTQASDIGAMPDTTTIEDLTTTAQLNALNSGATVTNIGQITTNQNNIADIKSLIPLQASTSNQLADKNFVNSSIATNTAYFIGTFNSVAELEAYSGTLTNNDYAFVATTDSAGNTLYDRYKYNADTQQWIFEYELNNSSFTAQQWASINSGITSGDVTLIGTALQPNDNISELINDVGYITSASLPTVNNGTLDIQVNGTSVGTFTANQSGNTTANIVVPDSATWGNITGTLSNQTDLQNALNGKYDASNPSGYITSADLPTNDVTTDTAQNISGRKTFLGEKAIYFKQTATTDKLGFTLYNPSGTELGALEWRPNTINGNAILTLNCPQSGSNYVGFRYWSNINIIAPRPTTNGNYYIPVNVTDGTNTVTANNNGTLNINSLLPDVSDMATKTWVTSQNYVNGTTLTNTLANYVTNSALTTTLADYALLTDIPTVNNGTLTIQKNGTTVGTFTANQSTNSTINIEADVVLTDDTTVSKNSDDELQAIGVIDDNTQNAYNFTVVGSPTITDNGIASGFSSSNYIKNETIAVNNKDFEVSLAIKTSPTQYTSSSVIFDLNASTLPFKIAFSASANRLYLSSSGGSSSALFTTFYTGTLATDTIYYIKTGVNGTKAYVSYSTDNKTWTTYQSTSFAENLYTTFTNNFIGKDNGSQFFANSYIDLKQFSITINGVEVYKAWQPPALKYWTGTKAQYDAIATKDANTLYNITDDNTADAYQAYTKSEVDTLIQDALYYKAGDTYTLSSAVIYPSFVTSSGTSIRFCIVTPKRLDNITTITCNTLITSFRKSDGGYVPTNLWDAKANATVNCNIRGSNMILVGVDYASGYGLTNNTPVGADINSISLTFS